MKKHEFLFNDTQRGDLVCCWKRINDRKKAKEFLGDVEILISAWLRENNKPRTTVANQIHHAARLNKNAEQLLKAAADMLDTLGGLPSDVSKILNIHFIYAAYGENYFKQHKEACKADRGLFRVDLARAFVSGLTGKELLQRATEVSKLPPDFLQQLEDMKGWLTPLKQAAYDLHKVTIGAREWQDREPEKNLLFTVALSYIKNISEKFLRQPMAVLSGNLPPIFQKYSLGILGRSSSGSAVTVCQGFANAKPATLPTENR